MATIRAFTTIEQSRKLAEILPLESADMHYVRVYFEGKQSDWFVKLGRPIKSDDIIPCYSLAALLGVLPRETRLLKSATDDIYYHCDCPKGNVDKWFDNPVDACVAMIERLNELNVL